MLVVEVTEVDVAAVVFEVVLALVVETGTLEVTAGAVVVAASTVEVVDDGWAASGSEGVSPDGAAQLAATPQTRTHNHIRRTGPIPRPFDTH